MENHTLGLTRFDFVTYRSMTLADLTPYPNARKKAQDRARELTAYVKANTSHIEWPEGLSPDDMQEQTEQVFYESEKGALKEKK